MMTATESKTNPNPQPSRIKAITDTKSFIKC